MQPRIEFLFQAAEAVVVDTDVTDSLGSDVAVRIEALKFLLEINALQVQGANPRGNLRLDAASDPGKAVAVVQALGNFVFGGLCVSWIDVSEAGEGARVGGLIFVVDLIGDCIDRVDLDRHGQLAHVAVVENAAARRHLKGALLLLLRALDVVVVANQLQPKETRRDGKSPKKKEKADEPKASLVHQSGAGCRAAHTRGAKWGWLHDGGGGYCICHLF